MTHVGGTTDVLPADHPRDRGGLLHQTRITHEHDRRLAVTGTWVVLERLVASEEQNQQPVEH
jgi:hypothetical protein